MQDSHKITDVPVTIDPVDLVPHIVALGEEQLIDFILLLDAKVADWEFTEKLATRLADLLAKEIQ